MAESQITFLPSLFLLRSSSFFLRSSYFALRPSSFALLTSLFVLLSSNFCPPAFAGSILGWGYNGYGQATPPPENNYIAISAGESHSLAIRSDPSAALGTGGTIVGWGRNQFGQATPPTGNNFIAISAGGWHSLALRSDGTIVGWGDNEYGQATPPPGNNYIAISAGWGWSGSHSLALRSDGTIVGWGDNTWGQARPPTGNNYIAISAGGYHSLALRSNGSIVGWGRNDYGQATPPPGNNYIAIIAGLYHSLALRSNGTIVGWGRNDYGQATPPPGNNYIAISAGWYHSLALRSDPSAALGTGGTIVGWGDKSYGQATPPAGNNYIAIEAGVGYGLALKSGIALKRLEINQCFQEVEADGTTQRYALIETKPFAARVTLEKDSPPGLTIKVKLAVYNANTGQQIGQTKQQTTTINPQSPETLDFLFNDNDTRNIKAGNYKFSLVVEDGNGAKLLESNLIYEFKSSRTVRMLVVPVLLYNLQIGVWNDIYIRFTEQVFPIPKTSAIGVNRLEILRGPALVMSDPNLSYLDLLLRLNILRQLYNSDYRSPSAEFISAVVPDGILPNAIGAMSGSAVVIQAHNDSQYILGHEMGHIYGLSEGYVGSRTQDANGLWVLDQWFGFDRNPPPLKLDPSGPFIIAAGRPNAGQRCNWADDTDSYSDPYSIKDANNNIIGWWCIGRYIGEGGYDIENNHEVSSSTFSMMSAGAAIGSSVWISGPEYKSLIAELLPTTATVLFEAPAPLSPVENPVLVSGIIDIPAKTARLSPLIPVSNLELTAEVAEPNCQLKFIPRLGPILGTFKFSTLESEAPESQLRGPFVLVVDLPPDTARIQVTIDGTVAAELQLTDNSPIVAVMSPNGGEEISGEMLVTWAASDQDNNDLSYTVEFSHDNGTEWSVLTIDHEVNELTVDANYLPGGPNCLVKVTVSDGWNRAEDISDAPFSITTKPPKVTILDPEDGTILLNSESMQGRCTVYDPETGDITDPNAIVWSSNIDGFLGNGNLTGFELSVGDHVLSATVTDPEGKTATDTAQVTVTANLADFNYDRRVDFLDLSKFAENWQANCSVPNWCGGTDLDRSGVVDFADLLELCENWLWQAQP
jgi:hypothetical protein